MKYEVRPIEASHNVLTSFEGAPPRIGEHVVINNSNTEGDAVFEVIDVIFYHRKQTVGCAVLVATVNPTTALSSFLSTF